MGILFALHSGGEAATDDESSAGPLRDRDRVPDITLRPNAA